MPTTRTRSGLRLTYDRGTWSDGRYAIGRVRAVESCAGPHPTRESGYCYGDALHDREIGWDIRRAGTEAPANDLPGYVGTDVYETLGEAWEALAAALRA